MRFFLGHRLPGGFYGGVSAGRYGRGRGARGTRGTPSKKTSNTSGIFWLLVIAAVVITVIVIFWKVAVPVLAVTAAAVVWKARYSGNVRRQQANTAASAPISPRWFDSRWFMWTCLVLCFPVGLALLWTARPPIRSGRYLWTTTTAGVAAVAALAISLAVVAGGGPPQGDNTGLAAVPVSDVTTTAPTPTAALQVTAPTSAPTAAPTAPPTAAPTQAPTPPPTAAPAPPPPTAVPVPVTSGFDVNAARAAGASAVCRDGSWSYTQHRSGTCSHHGGVYAWTGLI